MPLCLYSFFFFPLVFFVFSRATPAAYGDSQGRGLIGAVAAGLRHSPSNVRSEPHGDPHHSSWQHRILNPLRPGMELVSSWMLVRFVSAEP